VASLDPDYELSVRTYTAIWRRYERAGLDGLTPPARAVFLAWQFVGEVNNGGFRQFLCNPTGSHAPESPAALDEVGMPHAANLLRQTLEAGAPPWLPYSEILDAFTNEFFRSPENPYELIANYVRRHSKEMPPPVGT
jgi:hypothetical protein